MNDERLTRLQIRVDEIKDDVSELKAESKVMSKSLDNLKDQIIFHTAEVKAHVAGDNKIIDQLEPLINDLAEVVNDHKFRKEIYKRKMEKLKYWGARLGLVSLIFGLLATFSKIF